MQAVEKTQTPPMSARARKRRRQRQRQKARKREVAEEAAALEARGKKRAALAELEKKKLQERYKQRMQGYCSQRTGVTHNRAKEMQKHLANIDDPEIQKIIKGVTATVNPQMRNKFQQMQDTGAMGNLLSKLDINALSEKLKQSTTPTEPLDDLPDLISDSDSESESESESGDDILPPPE